LIYIHCIITCYFAYHAPDRADIADTRRANQELKRDLAVFEDVNALKSRLRYASQTTAADYDDIPS